MSRPDQFTDLGPLPKTDRNAELQRLSFREFKAALPTDKFVFRDERAEDAGVDASIELLAKSGEAAGYTNLRSQVQLKGTDCEEVNADGSISLQVKVSTLNYLLNGSSPLFALFVAPCTELRFAWAHDERKRLDELNSDWMQQETVTIRFSEHLTPVAIDRIYDRILREGRLQRRIQDTLASATISEQIIISINPETLATTNPDEAARLLLANGLTIVSLGFATQVMDQIRLLKTDVARNPRIQLILAYAQHTLARYQAALAHLREATLGWQELKSSDQDFLVYLRNACQFQTGCIDLEEYSRRVEIWEDNNETGFALAHRLDAMRHQLLNEFDMNQRARLFEELSSVVEEILSSDDEQNTNKLQAKFVLLHAEGGRLAGYFFHELFRIKMREGLRLPTDIQGLIQKLIRQWNEWERSLNDALQEAEAEGHPLLIAFALVSRATIRITLLSIIRFFISYSEIQVSMPKVIWHETISDIERSMNIYVRVGHLEGELRTKMLRADLHLLADRQAEARALAQEVLPKAEAMEYYVLIDRAREHLSGQAIMSRLEAEIRNRHTEDADFRWAAETDERLRELASEVLRELNLPTERLPILERDAFSMREISQERLSWCRYIELIQSLRHAEHPATHYLRDPSRYCTCEKYGYESTLGYPDWITVIAAFKQTYCKSCPSREPKVKES